MQKDSLRNRILAVLGLVALVFALYALWARPLQLRWGATDEEVKRSMPGDELDPTPGFLATRAITIQAAPEQIWPWLMQMGYGRAGLYGFDLFKKVGSPSVAGSVERILPQFQNFNVGDPIPLSPAATLKFVAIEPNRYIVWGAAGENAAYTWALYPVDATHTRLVSRVRWSYNWAQPAGLGLQLLTEFTDHLAVRKILQGIQGRVQAHAQPASDLNIEVFLYLGTFLVFIWSASSVLRLPLTWGSWLIGLSGGLAWLFTWYAPASIWLGSFFAMLVVWAIRVEFRDVQRARLAEQGAVKPEPGSKR